MEMVLHWAVSIFLCLVFDKNWAILGKTGKAHFFF